jgi:hypothetical protein
MSALRDNQAPLAFPVLSRFEDIADASAYAPLPDEWVIGVADVVNSTDAIAAGRYKTVNMAGAAVIAAVSNALGQAHFPFVFGGDGAAFALPADAADAAKGALASTATFVAEEYGLELRIAAVPIEAIRAAGLDVRIAEFAASADVRYAMFSGGGLAWAESEMKAGRFQLPKAPPGTRPDLTGLTCRFEPAPARRGLVLSLIVQPSDARVTAPYAALVRRILSLIEASPEMARPIPDGGPPLGWPPSGLDIEARTTRKPGVSLWASRLAALGRIALSTMVFKLGLPVGGFRPGRYLEQLVANSDYRKYDDGLRVTLDCTPELAESIEAMLVAAQRDGVARYGLHRQGAALMTCITPSIHRSDHIHFVDGAAGGYAAAASALKR